MIISDNLQSDLPRASVVVCAYNRPDATVRCLESLLCQDYPNYEIIVVDDASCDPSMSYLYQYISNNNVDNRIRAVTHKQNQGLSASRNHGISLASGDFILFIGPDCTAAKNWIWQMLHTLSAGECVALSGPVIDVGGHSWADLAIRGATNIVSAKNCGRPLIGNNMAFVARILRQFSFDNQMRLYADEDDLAKRLIKAGYRIGFAPDAIVYHNHPMTVGKYLRQAWLQGQGAAYYWWKHRIFIGRDILFLVLSIVTLPPMVKRAASACKNLAYLGKVNIADMPKVYASADIVCHPSWYLEGLPTVLLEGGAAGCALVAARTTGVDDIIPSSDYGLVVKPQDYEWLKGAVGSLILDVEKRKRLGQAIRQRVREEFDIQRVALLVESLLNAIVTNSQG